MYTQTGKKQEDSHQQDQKKPDKKSGAESMKQELKMRKGYWAIRTINKEKQGAEEKPVEEK